MSDDTSDSISDAELEQPTINLPTTISGGGLTSKHIAVGSIASSHISIGKWPTTSSGYTYYSFGAVPTPPTAYWDRDDPDPDPYATAFLKHMRLPLRP